MATSAMTTNQSPLDITTKLSETVYVHLPTNTIASKSTEEQPKLVLLLGWVNARDLHLARYVRDYQQKYPASTLILIKSRVAIVAFPSLARRDVSAALPVIEETLAKSEVNGRPKILVHLFSNGGSCLLSTLYDAWQPSSGRSSMLPLHVTIFDSAPSMYFEAQSAYTATMTGVPKGLRYWILAPFVKFMMFWWWVQYRVLHLPDRLAQIAASHNDKRRVEEARRLYVYSDKDLLVDAQHIEQHAQEARQRGFNVSKELFKDSPHVAHARTDPDRYWKLVDNVWHGR